LPKGLRPFAPDGTTIGQAPEPSQDRTATIDAAGTGT
jgi:hypothetical protein